MYLTRKGLTNPASVVLILGALLAWLAVLLGSLAGMETPIVHPSPSERSLLWLEAFRLEEEESGSKGGETVERQSRLEAPDLSLKIRTPPSAEDALSPAAPEREHEEYLSTIRTHAYTFSFERLGLKGVPIARTNRTHWNAQHWDELEEQLQFAMRFGLAAYPHSPPPGLPGNLVIAGHSSPPSPTYDGSYGRVFAVLPGARTGDRITITQRESVFTYEVTDIRVIPATFVDVLLQDENRVQLTLITCYPIGTTRERLIVSATLVEPRQIAKNDS
jgi:LPXTG-site transpeptidase (sortase) family protein